MKNNYMDRVYAELVTKHNYMPIINDNGQRIQFEGMRIVQKATGGKYTVVELMDADYLTDEQIRHKLDTSRNNLAQMGSPAVIAFQVFIFDSRPDELKLQSIKEGQMEDVYTKKFLPCIVVDLANKEVSKLYNLPIQAQDLEDTFKLILESDPDNMDSMHDMDKRAYINDVIETKDGYTTAGFLSKVPFVTYGLIMINIALWLIMKIYASVQKVPFESLFTSFGAKENFRILAGEYWRFLTPIFLHADLQHLMMNCLSLFVFGKIVEGLFGHKKFVFIYLLSGIIGNIASFMFSSHSAVGASGSIFGLLGALLYFSIENPSLFKRYFGNDIIIMVVINLVYGFVNPGIDNFGHIGGLIGGFLTSGIVKVNKVSNKLLGRPVFIAATIIVLSVGLYYGFNMSGNYKYFDLVFTGNLEEAEKKGEEIIGMKLADSDLKINTLFYLALAQSSQGKYEEAIEKANRVKDMDVSTGHYLFGVLYFRNEQYELARQELNEAVKLNSDLEDSVTPYLNQIEKELQ